MQELLDHPELIKACKLGNLVSNLAKFQLSKRMLGRCSKSSSLKELAALAKKECDQNVQRRLRHDAAITDVRPFAYCVEQVKNYDRENYVWLGQTAKDLRPSLFAIHAFNVELALIPDVVSQPTLAQIRYQWWRESINSLKGPNSVNHPVIQALSQVLGESATSRYKLQRIVSTREADHADAQPPATMSDLEQYADGTAGQIQALQLDAIGEKDSNADHAASHLGKAIGMASLLRGTARHAVRRRSYLPIELTSKEGVSEEEIYRGVATEKLQNVIFQVASVAQGHLQEAQALIPKLSKEVKGLMLGGVACGMYLTALEKRDFQIFSPELNAAPYTPLNHLLRLKYCSWRGRF